MSITELPVGRLLIGSNWLDEASGGTFDHVNPATGIVNGTLPMAGAAEIDQAVRAARDAFPAWKRMPPNERREIMLRIAALWREKTHEFAALVTAETGVPSAFAPVVGSKLPVDFFSYYAGWTDKLEGSTIPVSDGNIFDYTILEPHGVVAIIIPWNGPTGSIGMKVAPALAAGNCVVLKPPELAPWSSMKFAEVCVEAGLPPGVLNVVPGTSSSGEALVQHHDVNMISFTGGIETARKVHAAAAHNLTPLLFELGGKSANIVFDDADLDAAAMAAVTYSVVVLSGQGCTLGTRLLVQDAIYDEMTERVSQIVAETKVGLPSAPETVMGPVISEAHCARVQGFIERGRDDGAKLLVGGKRLGGELANGYFLSPAVFGDVDNRSELAQEEVFGPVLSILRFRDEADAIAMANDSKYGLAGYIWTENLSRAHRVVRDIEAGSMSINGFSMTPPGAPFGGIKGSGYGREGGKAGIDEFLRIKNVYADLRG